MIARRQAHRRDPRLHRRRPRPVRHADVRPVPGRSRARAARSRSRRRWPRRRNPSDFELKMRMFSRVSADRRRSDDSAGRRTRRSAGRAAAGNGIDGMTQAAATSTSSDHDRTARRRLRAGRHAVRRATGELDVAAFAANVRAHLAAGLHGVVVTGSTGEAALLDDDGARRARRARARGECRATQLLIVGTGAESTRT